MRTKRGNVPAKAIRDMVTYAKVLAGMSHEQAVVHVATFLGIPPATVARLA